MDVEADAVVDMKGLKDLLHLDIDREQDHGQGHGVAVESSFGVADADGFAEPVHDSGSGSGGAVGVAQKRSLPSQ